MQVQAAAMSVGDVRFVVVLAGLDLLANPGEADMTIETLSPTFGDAPIVLMGQKEDESPVYYGDADVVALLHDIPVDRMPWKTYSVR